MSRSRSRPGPGQKPGPRPWLVLASLPHGTRLRFDVARWNVRGAEVSREAFVAAVRAPRSAA